MSDAAIRWPFRRAPARTAAPLLAAEAESEVDAARRIADGEDGALARAALRGAPDAFDALVNRYSARIFTHLYRMVRNREEAEDLTQETFIRAYRHLRRYDAARPFRNWLYAIATNVGLNAIRARQRRQRTAEAVAEPPDPAPPAGPSEAAERLAEAIKRLPPQSAVLIHLHYHEGMRIREAAEIAGMSESAAKVALHRARKSLRTWFEENEAS